MAEAGCCRAEPHPQGAVQLAQQGWGGMGQSSVPTAIHTGLLCRSQSKPNHNFLLQGKFLLLSSLGNTYTCSSALNAASETAREPKKLRMFSSEHFLNKSEH